MTSIGTWKPAPISDRHLEDIERGMHTANFQNAVGGIGEWEIHGIIARLRAAEAYIAQLEHVARVYPPLRAAWLASKTEPSGPGAA